MASDVAVDVANDVAKEQAAVQFDKLREIADEVEPLEASWLQAWSADADSLTAKLTETAARVNAVLEPRVDEIARLTNNSASTIRQVFAPTSAFHVWFSQNTSPAAFLRNVSKHRSFNTEYWRDREIEIAMDDLRKACLESLAASGSSADGSPASLTAIPASEAAAAVVAGGVPVVEADQMAGFLAGLAAAGVVEQRWGAGGPKRWAAQHFAGALAAHPNPASLVSSCRSFAFVMKDKSAFCFWPAHRTVEHASATPLDRLQESADSPSSRLPAGAAPDEQDRVGRPAHWRQRA